MSKWRMYAIECQQAWNTVAKLQRHALPDDCEDCNGTGCDLPVSPWGGPCGTCGGWTNVKRARAARLAESDK